MRKIYMVDLGLLVAAGTIAAVLTAKPISSQPDDGNAHTAAIAVPEASVATPTARGSSAERVAYEEDDSGSH